MKKDVNDPAKIEPPVTVATKVLERTLKEKKQRKACVIVLDNTHLFTFTVPDWYRYTQTRALGTEKKLLDAGGQFLGSIHADLYDWSAEEYTNYLREIQRKELRKHGIDTEQLELPIFH